MVSNLILSQAISNIFANNQIGLQQELRRRKQRSKKGPSQKELELAVAVLLVDLASCDEHFDPEEREAIIKGMRRIFGTSRPDVIALMNQASLALENLRGPAAFADLLKENLNDDEKQVVMEVIEEVIMADNVEDGFETYLRSRFAQLLGIKKADKPAESK